MRILVYLFGFSVLGAALMATVGGDSHGGVHINIPSCEEGEEGEDQEKVPDVCMELKPWYYHQQFDDHDEIEDQSYRLQDDTAWPAQREDFSDYLMR